MAALIFSPIIAMGFAGGFKFHISRSLPALPLFESELANFS